ncbi:hypothetical protein SUSAZ_01505 [Sulfolobus acidocaldarius SUSAZ]|nr:hypothetical protein SUSAZ_01505 [Sulfolobus acidocaldarius SUSAZ]
MNYSNNDKSKYALVLGALSGVTTLFFFLSLDLYALLYGPIMLLISPLTRFVLPVIIGSFVAYFLTKKFKFSLRLSSVLISCVISLCGYFVINLIILSFLGMI